jgi:alpha-glucosidase
MQMYKDAGMHSIKIGQVGSRLMMKEWHYGQYGVEYYDFVLAKAAEYKLTVNFHEPIKQTGKHRTYPHWFSAEGARGQEYNAWSEGNPPEHTVILPFTRMLGGSMDFTPGMQDVPVNWETTKVLNAKIGDYYTVVRKDIDSNDWYLGSITDENELQLMVNLDFLEPGKKYRAEIYADAADAEFDKNPEAYKILEKEVDSTMDLTIQLAKGGGQAIRFVAL